MEPLYIILVAVALFVVLLALFTAATRVIPGIFRQPEGAKSVRELQGR